MCYHLLTILTTKLVNLYFFGKGDVLLFRFRDTFNITAAYPKVSDE